MKKSVLSFASVAVLSFSTIFAQAQPTVTSTAVSGSMPRPQAVSGSMPRPQAVSGSMPRPTALGSVLSSVALYFGYVL